MYKVQGQVHYEGFAALALKMFVALYTNKNPHTKKHLLTNLLYTIKLFKLICLLCYLFTSMVGLIVLNSFI